MSQGLKGALGDCEHLAGEIGRRYTHGSLGS
jgi:hypothetical protein